MRKITFAFLESVEMGTDWVVFLLIHKEIHETGFDFLNEKIKEKLLEIIFALSEGP